jgi:hypothetical protein
MARKRSLKDAAADRLVEKKRTAVKTTVKPPEIPASAPTAVTPVQAETAEESRRPPPSSSGASQADEAGKKGGAPSLGGAILIAVGFGGGFFFGMGQAVGPANLAYLLIGLAAGYFLGRFYRVIRTDRPNT